MNFHRPYDRHDILMGNQLIDSMFEAFPFQGLHLNDLEFIQIYNLRDHLIQPLRDSFSRETSYDNDFLFVLLSGLLQPYHCLEHGDHAGINLF